MIGPEPAAGFRFDFADLRPPPLPALRLLPPALEALPPDAVAVIGRPRPRGLAHLLPVIRACAPLRVSVVDAAAPVWGLRLGSAMAALLACAGEDHGLRVWWWKGGLAAGPPGFDQMPRSPQAVVITAECDRSSIVAAAELLEASRPGRAYLAIHGAAPALDRDIGLDDGLKGAVWLARFPMLADRDLRRLADARAQKWDRGRFALACLDLTREILARYHESEE